MKFFRDPRSHGVRALDPVDDAREIEHLTGATSFPWEDVTSQVLQATVEVGPSDFLVTHVFDCGGPALAFLEGTLTAAAPDGETFGLSAGDIAADVRSVDPSSNGVDLPAAVIGAWYEDHPYDGSQMLPHAGWQKFVITPRYVIVTVNIIDGLSFDPYAGANHPTASFDLTLTAR